MLLNSLYVVSGLVLLPLGAEALVRGSTGLALRTGVTTLAIGLTVVAFGTGSPELVLSIQAALAGNGGITLGNVVGSNIANITLVLGSAALARPMTVRSELVRREIPLMIVVTLLLCVLLVDGRLSRPEGLLLVVGAVAYTIFTYLGTRRREVKEIVAEVDEALIGSERSLWLDIILLVVGLGVLLAGAYLLLKATVAIGAELGISQVVIGLTVVALGTSLPELATSVTSALHDKADVAFGNVIGSSVLNILAVLGIAVLIHPFEVQGLRALDLAVLVASAVLLLPLMWRGWVLNRWEGAVLLTGYAVYMYTLVP